MTIKPKKLQSKVNKAKQAKQKLDETMELAAPSIKSDGGHNGHKPDEDKEFITQVSKQSVANAFHQERDKSALRYYVETGDLVKDILLRTDLPERITEGTVKAVAFADELAKARYFNRPDDEDETLTLLALLPSVNGKRINLMTDAVIGERRMEYRNSIGGFGDKLKRMAFGGRNGNDGAGT